MKKHPGTQLTLSLIVFVTAIAGCTNPAKTGPTASAGSTADPSLSSLVSGTAIPFQDLSKGFKLGGTLSEPTLLVATDDDEKSMGSLVAFVSAKDQALLEEVDLKKELVMAVFWGVKPSGGFSITVNGVFIDDNELIVSVILKEKDPAFPMIEAFTLPYHLITIGRDMLPEKDKLTYRLVSEDEVLATGELP